LQCPALLTELTRLCSGDAAEREQRTDIDPGTLVRLRKWQGSLRRLQRLARPHWNDLEQLSDAPDPPSAAVQALERNRLLGIRSVKRLRVPAEVLEQLRGAVMERLLDANDEVAPPGAPSTLAKWLAQTEQDISDARARILAANQGLVGMLANRYIGMGLSRADLKQEGNIGLMRAIDKFDAERGVRFGTYAVWWIRQAMQRALSNQSRTIRLPSHVVSQRHRLALAKSSLMSRLARSPSAQELADETGLRVAQIERVSEQPAEPLSLDAPRHTDANTRLVDVIADQTAADAYDSTVQSRYRARLDELLAELLPRERAVLRLRFGIGRDHECTLEQVGEAMGVTRERARQLVNKGLHKLRRAAVRRGLEIDFSS
jgi:RNA polymerase sigma factor (sigma-70 family)